LHLKVEIEVNLLIFINNIVRKYKKKYLKRSKAKKLMNLYIYMITHSWKKTKEYFKKLAKDINLK